ncbi:Protein of unknown function [Amphritea atlantica]|uniref:DUF2834 domain-containing protein n=1 Tax=Amphritea atlantica TaxID=355243 RepID=A0A1H9KUC5_9GAMM|nr:DUF2834 domain-containing protein [Amphritea atlantica]SER02403.1 Protein of unknown function [Amphritea atlantica]
MKYLYLILCVFGTLLPLSQFVPWVAEHGVDIPLFIQELFSTRIGAFFGWDVIISAVVLLVFIFTESKRIQMPHLWLPVVATLSIGVSLGLPLFLYLRDLHIESNT